jgi:hypothetical protein
MTDQTRLERITLALLGSDYVKMAFLEASNLVGMARLIELQLTACAEMTEEQAHAQVNAANSPLRPGRV